MTNTINISPISDLHSIPAHRGVGGSSTIGDSHYSDSTSAGVPSWFNPTVPSQGTVSPTDYPGTNDTISKLYRMLEWLANNPGNVYATEIFMQFLANLDHSGFLAKNPQIIKMLASVTGSNSIFGSYNLIQALVDVYVLDHHDEGLSAIMAQLNAMFPPGTGGELSDMIHARMLQWTQGGDSSLWQKLATAQANDRSYQGEISLATPDGLRLFASQMWGMLFIDSSGTSANEVLRSIRMEMMEEVIREFKENPLIALMLLLFLLNDSSDTNQISGLGSTASFLKDRTNDLNDLITQWEAGYFTPDSAKQFVQDLMNLRFTIANSPISGDIKDTMLKQIDTILNTNYIGGLYDRGMFSELADALNSSANSIPQTLQIITPYSEMQAAFEEIANDSSLSPMIKVIFKSLWGHWNDADGSPYDAHSAQYLIGFLIKNRSKLSPEGQNAIDRVLSTVVSGSNGQSLEDLYNSGDGDALAAAMNKARMSGTTAGHTVGPSGTPSTTSPDAILNALKTMAGATTTQAQTTTTMLQQVVEREKQLDGVLQSFLKDSVEGQNTAIIRNLVSA